MAVPYNLLSDDLSPYVVYSGTSVNPSGSTAAVNARVESGVLVTDQYTIANVSGASRPIVSVVTPFELLANFPDHASEDIELGSVLTVRYSFTVYSNKVDSSPISNFLATWAWNAGLGAWQGTNEQNVIWTGDTLSLPTVSIIPVFSAIGFNVELAVTIEIVAIAPPDPLLISANTGGAYLSESAMCTEVLEMESAEFVSGTVDVYSNPDDLYYEGAQGTCTTTGCIIKLSADYSTVDPTETVNSTAQDLLVASNVLYYTVVVPYVPYSAILVCKTTFDITIGGTVHRSTHQRLYYHYV